MHLYGTNRPRRHPYTIRYTVARCDNISGGLTNMKEIWKSFPSLQSFDGHLFQAILRLTIGKCTN